MVHLEGLVDVTTRLLPTTSLSSIPSIESHDWNRATKRRRKEKESKGNEKKSKCTTANFSAMVKFNFQPTPRQSPPAESINDNPSIETEEFSAIGAPLAVVHEEGFNETESLELFGDGEFTVKTEEMGSNEVLAEEWSEKTPNDTKGPDSPPSKDV